MAWQAGHRKRRHRPSPTWTPRGTGDDLLYRWIDDLKSMALQSLQLSFCLDQFRFSQHLWRSEDTRRRPTGRLLYGNKFALRGSMGKSPRHIVRVARLIKANMTQRVTRVPEVYEHEAAFCHAPPTRSNLSLESQLLPPRDPLGLWPPDRRPGS